MLRRTLALFLGTTCAALVLAGGSSPGSGAPLRYIALGDSFSSGEGDPPYRAATDRYLPPHDICHRSYRAYPELVAGRRSSPGTWGFWACSGARLYDMTSPNRENPVEIAQLDRIAPPGRSDPGVNLVTLTIGGNDAQFNVVWVACMATRIAAVFRATCAPHWRDFVTTAIRKVRSALPAFFRQLRARAPNARLLVLGYPDPFPAALPPASRCELWFSGSDLRWLTQQAAALNGAVAAAASASSANVTYVAPTGFAGHDACSAQPWFNGLELAPDRIRGSFHPNVLGQRRLAKLVLARI
jgi:lysophospholipase L1-like esterase